jgi:hypothetical protein
MNPFARWIGAALVFWASFDAGAGEAGRPAEADGAPPASSPAPAAPAGGKSVADWIAELRSPAILRRVCAADALGAMGAGAKDAVPVLIGYLDEKELWVLFAIVDALAAIGEPAVPALAEALGSGNDNARVRALQGLEGDRACGQGRGAGDPRVPGEPCAADPDVGRRAAPVVRAAGGRD